MNNYNYTKVLATSIIASALFLKSQSYSCLSREEQMESCIDDAFELSNKIFNKARKESGE